MVKVSATEVLVHLASGREGRMHVTQFAPAAAEGKVKGAKGGAAAAAASPLARFEVRRWIVFCHQPRSFLKSKI